MRDDIIITRREQVLRKANRSATGMDHNESEECIVLSDDSDEPGHTEVTNHFLADAHMAQPSQRSIDSAERDLRISESSTNGPVIIIDDSPTHQPPAQTGPGRVNDDTAEVQRMAADRDRSPVHTCAQNINGGVCAGNTGMSTEKDGSQPVTGSVVPPTETLPVTPSCGSEAAQSEAHKRFSLADSKLACAPSLNEPLEVGSDHERRTHDSIESDNEAQEGLVAATPCQQNSLLTPRSVLDMASMQQSTSARPVVPLASSQRQLVMIDANLLHTLIHFAGIGSHSKMPNTGTIPDHIANWYGHVSNSESSINTPQGDSYSSGESNQDAQQSFRSAEAPEHECDPTLAVSASEDMETDLEQPLLSSTPTHDKHSECVLRDIITVEEEIKTPKRKTLKLTHSSSDDDRILTSERTFNSTVVATPGEETFSNRSETTIPMTTQQEASPFDNEPSSSFGEPPLKMARLITDDRELETGSVTCETTTQQNYVEASLPQNELLRTNSMSSEGKVHCKKSIL